MFRNTSGVFSLLEIVVRGLISLLGVEHALLLCLWRSGFEIELGLVNEAKVQTPLER